MVRALGQTLINLCQSANQEPTMTVTVQDTLNRFAQVATNGDAGGRTAVLQTSGGSVLRARVTQGADPNALAVQRITSPLVYSQWSAAYPAAIASNCRASAGCALTQRPSDGVIFVFYQSTADQKIKYRTSPDDGVTWGGEVDLGIALPLGIGNFCYGIAATATGATVNVYAAYAAYDPGGNATLVRTTSVGGGAFSGYASEGPATPTWGKVRGLQAHPAVSGTTEYFAWGVQTRAGLNRLSGGHFQRQSGSYSTVYVPQQLDNPSLGLQVAYPSVHYDGTTFYYAATLFDDGSVSGLAGNRTTVYTSADAVNWYPWQAFSGLFSYGAHALSIAGTVLLFDGTVVYAAPAPAGPTDVTADVLAISIHERGNRPASAVIRLANQSGQWTNSSALRLDARVTVSLGYVDPVQGPVLVQTHLLVIEGIANSATALSRTVELRCRDLGKLLDYPSSKLRAYLNQTVGQLVGYLCGLARLSLAGLPGTAQFGQTVGCYVLSAGETLLVGLERVANIYQFDWWVDGTGTVRVVERQASDPPTWTYTTLHLGITYGTEADQANVIRVIGQGSGTGQVYADVVDGANLLGVGLERWRQEVERMLDTSAKCRIKANLLLREEQTGSVAAQMVVPLNPAHELMDVIAVTDAAVGLSGTSLRIHGIDTVIHPEQGLWEQTLHLEGP